VENMAFSIDLSGKVAIVTGASRGIGEAIALGLAQAGAKVALASRKPEGLEEVAAKIQEAGSEAIVVPTNTSEREAIKNLVAQTTEKFGGVDIVVNNAATNPHFGPLLSSDENQWDKTIKVNLQGYFWLVKDAYPSMKERGGGKVVNVASIAGLQNLQYQGLYGITKTSVIHMTGTLAVELGPDNIQVNAIAPGFVKTKFSSVLWQNEELANRMINMTPVRRIADPEDIAPLVVFLSSAHSNFITGQAFVIDGGITKVPAS
jgi:NAD(P)-dependent dehydrogenase (short-subunit alcohol dehydrogenase family)